MILTVIMRGFLRGRANGTIDAIGALAICLKAMVLPEQVIIGGANSTRLGTNMTESAANRKERVEYENIGIKR